MRYVCVALILGWPSLTFGDPACHVRPIDARAAASLARAIARSPLVRDLVDRLTATNVIIHFELSHQMPPGVIGMTRFGASRGGYRFLRVAVAAALRDDDAAPLIGHELQHALEIAQSDVADVADLRRLMQATGYRTGGTMYETDAARAIEKDVRRELRVWRSARRSLQAEPVVELHHEHLGAAGPKATTEIPKR